MPRTKITTQKRTAWNKGVSMRALGMSRPRTRFEIRNCQTLCVPCHYEKTFGRILPAGKMWTRPRRAKS